MEERQEGETSQLRPILALKSTVIFPLGVATVQVASPSNIALLKAHNGKDAEIALVYCDAGRDEVAPADLLRTAVVCRVLDRLNLPGDTIQLTFHGLRRAKVVEIERHDPYFIGRLEPVDETPKDRFKVNVLVQKAINIYERLAASGRRYEKDLLPILKNNVEAPGRFADLLAAALPIDYAGKLAVIRAIALEERLEFVLGLLQIERDRMRVAREVEKRAKGDMDDSRREFYLRQQMKAIRKELGEEDLSQRDADDYTEQLEALKLPEDTAKEPRREIERLRHIQPSSSEFQVIKTFLDRFFALPWSESTVEEIELPRVSQTLDDGHFGLEKVKARILEFLAVRKLNPNHKGPILCFAGPPGVGKTSLGRAIAEAIGRRFFRISVGGVRDEAEIRGHRRTYVGAMPGKILAGLTRVGCNNPLLMLDEIDKIGADHRGDPAAALLEVLDPEQNDTFTDHYFNVPFDLSKVLFVVTANYLHDIPPALRDRLEVITIEGYTETEKLEIARRHLVDRVVKEHGLSEMPPVFSEPCLREIIRFHTREAGVRNLQRALQKVSRKLARARVEAEGNYEVPLLGVEEVRTHLGPHRYSHDEGMEGDLVGVANGLAWTASGGELLLIEALKMDGSGKMILTGKLGEVMKESVQAAHSFVRSRAEALGIDTEALRKLDLHIHFPAGAVPKDGPSAGVTITLAIASLLSGRPVRADFAMTGEVTLRGKVLQVGGVKDKILAAHRAGIQHIVLPKGNENDLEELPEEVREALTFYPISHVDELLKLALLED